MRANEEEKEEAVLDYYLSDVHVEGDEAISGGGTDSTNQFRLEVNMRGDLECDSDGDLVVSRRKLVLNIEFSMKTLLSDVGLQLWRASFYLADYLIHNPTLTRDSTVLDLGAGLGVCSLIAALNAKMVYCTDLPHIVQQAEKNFHINRDFLKEMSSKEPQIKFKQLDWSMFKELDAIDFDSADPDALNKISVYLAADVVYDNLITIYFMNCLYSLMTHFGNNNDRNAVKTCFVSNEQRVNFSCELLKSGDTAFSYFRKCLDELDNYIDEEKQVGFRVCQVECDDLPHYVCNYKRNKYLSIWKIESFRV